MLTAASIMFYFAAIYAAFTLGMIISTNFVATALRQPVKNPEIGQLWIRWHLIQFLLSAIIAITLQVMSVVGGGA